MCKYCGMKCVRWNKEKCNEWLKEHGENTILEGEYTNAHDSNLTFICGCGATFHRRWNNVKDQKQIKCEECSGRIVWNKDKCNEWLKEHGEGTVLVSEYTNSKDNSLKFKCGCGNEFKRSWHGFVVGKLVKCEECIGQIKWNKEKCNEWLKEHGEGTVLESEYTSTHDNSLTFICGCGNKFKRSWHNVKDQKQIKCLVCTEKSKGEQAIEAKLTKDQVEHEKQHKCGCKNKQELPFDNALFKDGKLVCLIEFDGKQHFEAIEFFGGEEGLEYRKQNDYLKSKYCASNNIPLVRIPYWEYDKIDELLEKVYKLFNII